MMTMTLLAAPAWRCLGGEPRPAPPACPRGRQLCPRSRYLRSSRSLLVVASPSSLSKASTCSLSSALPTPSSPRRRRVVSRSGCRASGGKGAVSGGGCKGQALSVKGFPQCTVGAPSPGQRQGSRKGRRQLWPGLHGGSQSHRRTCRKLDPRPGCCEVRAHDRGSGVRPVRARLPAASLGSSRWESPRRGALGTGRPPQSRKPACLFIVSDPITRLSQQKQTDDASGGSRGPRSRDRHVRHPGGHCTTTLVPQGPLQT